MEDKTWQDTVMDDYQIQPILDRVANVEKKSQSEVRRQIAKAQAEISFKAGIRVVVEWVEANALGTHPIAFSIAIVDWQAKLKE